jgi:peptide/nickel transport system permease protein
MSVIVFFAIFVIGDPVEMLIDLEATEREIAAIRQALGLDLPVYMQYFQFLSSTFRGDFGTSFVFNEPALKLILTYLPATLELAITAMMIAILVGIPLGMYAGVRPQHPVSKTIMAGSILGFSLPTFWSGLMTVLVFSVWAGWLPASGRGSTVDILGVQLSIFTADGLSHLILPALNLALFKISLVIRLARAGTREVIMQDYIKFAKAKGLPSSRIILVHVGKNILIPIVTVLGLELGSVVAFAVVTESVFAWPGIGKLLIDSIGLLDRPVIVAYLLLVVVMFVTINLLVDILYSVLDPRVQLARRAA